MAVNEIKEKTQWICNLCYPNAEEIGMIFDGCALILHEGKYHIVIGQGHKGDIAYTFENKPFPDPDPECEIEELEEKSDQWMEEILTPFEDNFKLSPQVGYWLVTSFYNTYPEMDEPRNFSVQFVDVCGKLVEKSEKETSNDAD